jgi:uncharacterized protein (TIGR04551 family)
MRWYLSICLGLALSCVGSAAAQAQPTSPPDASKPGASKTAAPAAPAPAAPTTQPPAAAPAPQPPPGAQTPTPSPDQAQTPAPAQPAPGEQPAPAPQEEGAPAPAAPEAGAGAEAPAPESVLPPPAAPGAEVPSPGDMENLLSAQVNAARPNTDWTAPSPVFTLHGYLRVRGELMDNFWLGREALNVFTADTTINSDVRKGQGPDPFTKFRPIERRREPGSGRAPSGLDCADEGTKSDGTCDVSTLRFANMRLRLAPELAISEDVRIKMRIDVFDNLVLGEPPLSFYGTSPVDKTVFASTLQPPPDGAPGLGDSIRARDAWAEVRNRDLGELRFGRMPMNWGLGMFYNAGDGVDQDLSTDIDRVVGITKLAGMYLSASYDFIGEGALLYGSDDRPLEQSQLDDVDQFTFSVARRNTPEELQASRERGESVLNGGAQFVIRNQDSLYNPQVGQSTVSVLQTINATTYTTDLWGMFRYKGLRIEGEFAWINGGMDTLDPTAGSSYKINQFGYALETELRLLDDKLGIYFDQGLATGDSSVEGLSSGSTNAPGTPGGNDTADYVTQLDNDRTVSTFRFNPSYHVDLILWRNIMRQVTGAYYFRPSISYDFVRNAFGQLAGAKLDFIYSRAASVLQTWGNDPNLGFEIDGTLYFRSEDGPDLTDGFQAMLQYGVLFPMAGLGYLHEDTDLHTAQTLRLVLAVVY